MKVQILVEDQQYDCSLFKKAFEQAKQNYPEMPLSTIDLIFNKSVINLEADLLINPINTSSLKVGFKSKIISLESIFQPQTMNWITINDHSGEGLNAVSNFLLLILGTVVLFSNSIDLDDIKAAMLLGKHGIMTSISSMRLYDPDEAVSCVVWSSYKGKLMAEYSMLANTVVSNLRKQDLLFFISLTEFPIMNKNNIVLMVKK